MFRDADLAMLYGVATKALVQAVKRNLVRFPIDFMFQLTAEEVEALRSQFVTSEADKRAAPRLDSSASTGRGRRRYRPYAFTEQGVAMLSSVLRSHRAVRVNIQIVRTFVRLRRLLASHERLAHRLDALERKYDRHFKVVFDAIRQMMIAPDPGTRRRIGFAVDVKQAPDKAGGAGLSAHPRRARPNRDSMRLPRRKPRRSPLRA